MFDHKKRLRSMSKGMLRLIISLFVPTTIFSQSLAPSTLGAQGGYDQTKKIAMEWTLGEIFTETVRTGDQIITQGFLQSALKVTQEKTVQPAVAVHPNPVSEILNIQVQGCTDRTYIISLFSRDGVCVMSTSIPAGESTANVDMSNMPPGFYVLRVTAPPATLYESHRIIKK
jgi:hypothetical protein